MPGRSQEVFLMTGVGLLLVPSVCRAHQAAQLVSETFARIDWLYQMLSLVSILVRVVIIAICIIIVRVQAPATPSSSSQVLLEAPVSDRVNVA